MGGCEPYEEVVGSAAAQGAPLPDLRRDESESDTQDHDSDWYLPVHDIAGEAFDVWLGRFADSELRTWTFGDKRLRKRVQLHLGCVVRRDRVMPPQRHIHFLISDNETGEEERTSDTAPIAAFAVRRNSRQRDTVGTSCVSTRCSSNASNTSLDRDRITENWKVYPDADAEGGAESDGAPLVRVVLGWRQWMGSRGEEELWNAFYSHRALASNFAGWLHLFRNGEPVPEIWSSCLDVPLEVLHHMREPVSFLRNPRDCLARSERHSRRGGRDLVCDTNFRMMCYALLPASARGDASIMLDILRREESLLLGSLAPALLDDAEFVLAAANTAGCIMDAEPAGAASSGKMRAYMGRCIFHVASKRLRQDEDFVRKITATRAEGDEFVLEEVGH